MQKKTNKLTIIASIFIIYGILRFLPSIKLFYFTIKHFGKIHTFLPNLLLNMLDNVVFPLCFIVGGIFTLRLKNSGRILLLITITVDLTIRLFAIVNYWYQSMKFSQMIAINPNIAVKFTHAWYAYIVIFFELIFAFYLTHPKIKKRFGRINFE
ncbi:MAG: hypothetical protein ISS47_10355 [Candidatus Omnitrophica bacterium]|nr:hypothetical protein [Candidatus Omnitrophota bacterium]